MVQHDVSPAHRNAGPPADADRRSSNVTSTKFGAHEFAMDVPRQSGDIDLHEVRIAAARARIAADEKRGRATDEWIVRLASQAS